MATGKHWGEGAMRGWGVHTSPARHDIDTSVNNIQWLSGNKSDFLDVTFFAYSEMYLNHWL